MHASSLPQSSWHPVPQKLHLGCGGNLLAGWGNVDLSTVAGVIQHDLTAPFPIPSQSVAFIYSEHFVEHLTRDEGSVLLKECHRVLAPEGVLRISTPNLKKVVDEYLAGRTSEWSDVGWRPKTPCQMVNEALRLWKHQFVYDIDEITSVLKEAGFQRVTPVNWRESQYAELKSLESRPFHGDLIIEATK